MEHHQRAYADWLDTICQRPIPPAVVAFNVNLYDAGSAGFYDAEVIGAAEYDAQDEDWSCYDIFNSGLKNRFELPASVVDTDWEKALQLFVNWTRLYCEDVSNHGDVFRHARAVTVRFVDGNLMRVWPPLAVG